MKFKELVKPYISPVFRIYDYNNAIEFYINWLGFKIDFEDRPKPDIGPTSVQISMNGIIIKLTDRDDCVAEGEVEIYNFQEVRKYYEKLMAKNYKKAIKEKVLQEDTFLYITDPFGNKLTFSEPPVCWNDN